MPRAWHPITLLGRGAAAGQGPRWLSQGHNRDRGKERQEPLSVFRFRGLTRECRLPHEFEPPLLHSPGQPFRLCLPAAGRTLLFGPRLRILFLLPHHGQFAVPPLAVEQDLTAPEARSRRARRSCGAKRLSVCYAAGRRYRPVATSMCGVQSGQNPSIVRPANQLDGFSTRPVSRHVAQRYDGTTNARAGAAGVGGSGSSQSSLPSAVTSMVPHPSQHGHSMVIQPSS